MRDKNNETVLPISESLETLGNTAQNSRLLESDNYILTQLSDLSKENIIKNLNNIPDELKKTNSFGISYLDGKNKRPYRKIGLNFPFNEAIKEFEYEEQRNINKLPNRYLGINFSLNNNFMCIDLDDCYDNNNCLFPYAAKIISKLKGLAYVEKSWSRQGLHIFVFCHISHADLRGINKQINTIKEFEDVEDDKKIEIYTCKKVMLLTGNVLENYEKICCYSNNAMIQSFILDTNTNNTLPDKNIVSKIRQPEFNNNIFKDIKDRVSMKQILDYYNISVNKEDKALCPFKKEKTPSFYVYHSTNTFKCFGCGEYGDIINFVAKMEGLEMRESAKKINDVFNLGLLVNTLTDQPKVKDVKVNKNENEILLPLDPEVNKNKNEYVEIIRIQGGKLPQWFKFVPWIIEKENKKTGEIKVSVNTGYLAKFLRENVDYIFLRENAKEGIQRFIYSNGVYNLANDYDYKHLVKIYIPESFLKMGMVNEVKENLYTDDRYYTYSKLNPEKYINFKDGLLNIETNILEAHTPKILTTIQLPLCYNNLQNECKTNYFDNYINYLVDNDDSKKQLILEFMGVCLSNIYGHRMKKALFMVGPHNTGKSKIKELLIKLLGEQNANTLDLETLEARFGSSNVFNKRLIGSNDMSFLTIKELKVFKLLTGGDTLFMENKGENGFNAKFNGIAWFCCNELPRFGGDKGEGVYNRFAIVECNQTPLSPELQDKKLLENMLTEKNYIVCLALKALKNVIKNNYTYSLPQSSIDTLQNYKIDNDSFLKFVNECTIDRPGGKITDNCTRKRLYDVYSAWCKDNNNGYKESKKECKEKLERLGKADILTVDGIRYYSKFTLNLETKNDYKSIYGYDLV